MFVPAPQTALARFSCWQARAILALLAVYALFCVGLTLSPKKIDNRYHNRPGEGDLALYRAEAKRIRAGEGYYSAIATELRERGYPTRSVLNWRTPLPVWLIGKLPPGVAQWLLCGAAIVVLALSVPVIEREDGSYALLIGIPLLFGALAAAMFDELYVLSELWAGVFIALSLVSYGAERRGLGFVAGIAAQFLRELSAVYSAVALGMALYERRWREATAWFAGLALYAGFWAYHWQTVRGLIRPDDLAHAQGWLQLGGTAFIVSTAHMNSLLLLLPQWVVAIYFALAMLGFASWSTPAGVRFALTMTLFVAAFGVVGQYFNQYWGAIYAPLLCYGAARAPLALRDLWRASEWGSPLRTSPSPCIGQGS